MNVRIFDIIHYDGQPAQIIYIDDSSVHLKIDNRIIWVSIEDLEALLKRADKL